MLLTPPQPLPVDLLPINSDSLRSFVQSDVTCNTQDTRKVCLSAKRRGKMGAEHLLDTENQLPVKKLFGFQRC